MPAQYSGLNKVSNVPGKIRKPGMGSAPRKSAFATPAKDKQSNAGVGSGGSTQAGTSGGRNQIGGQANGGGSARIGAGGLAPMPGTSMKRMGAGRTPTPRGGDPNGTALRSTATSRPFNAMKQKALAKALRSRNSEPYNPGGV